MASPHPILGKKLIYSTNMLQINALSIIIVVFCRILYLKLMHRYPIFMYHKNRLLILKINLTLISHTAMMAYQSFHVTKMWYRGHFCHTPPVNFQRLHQPFPRLFMKPLKTMRKLVRYFWTFLRHSIRFGHFKGIRYGLFISKAFDKVWTFLRHSIRFGHF